MDESDALVFLDPSALGTREHWEKVYEQETENYLEDPDDEGVVWFAESRAEEKILEFLETLPLKGSVESNAENSHLRILDIGTGNGHQLFALKDKGWKAEMIGIDYSKASVNLARKIREDRAPKHGSGSIAFETWDILKDPITELLQPAFDVGIDKGTFDAISLDSTEVEENRRGCELYPHKVLPLIKNRGYLIVTSCNWTEAELKKWFDIPGLSPTATINYPSFTFGGKSGQAVSGVCFQKQDQTQPS